MIGEYLLFNQKLISKSNFNKLEKSDYVVYEVLRIIDKIPLFYTEHIERLKFSCAQIGEEIDIEADLLYLKIRKLISVNKVSDGNLMIKVFFHANYHDVSAYLIQHSYPSFIDYKNGVEVDFLGAERINPEAKVEQGLIREKANKIITEKGVYEVLLLDRNNQLTEGSRSNLFVIKNNVLITSPLKKVLKGITLSKVIEIADQLNIDIEYRNVSIDELSSIDAMFITGTSPKILPIKKADTFTFNVKHPILFKIIKQYDVMIKNNCRLKI